LTVHARDSAAVQTPKHRYNIGRNFTANHPPPGLCYRPTVFFPHFPLIALYLPPGKIRYKLKKIIILFNLLLFKIAYFSNWETRDWQRLGVSAVNKQAH